MKQKFSSKKLTPRSQFKLNQKSFFLFAFTLTVLFGIWPARIVQAASDHYFSYLSGSDTTGDGTISNPWKSLDVASTECGDGDTCYFKKGDTWDLTQSDNQQLVGLTPVGIKIGASNVIFKSDDSFGSGELPIFDGGSTTDLRTFIYGAVKDNIIIDGIKFQNGFVNSSTCASDGNCHSIWGDSSTNWEIKNSTFQSVYNGIFPKGCGYNIHNNTMSTLAHDGIFFFVPGDCTANKNRVYQNYITETEYNGVDIVGSGVGTNAQGVQVYQNYISDVNNCIEVSRGNYNEIYSNVLSACLSPGSMLGGILIAIGSSNNKVYNNTVYNSTYGLIIGQYTGSSCTEQGTDNEAKNNITMNSVVAEIHICSEKSNVLSNNLHYNSTETILKEDNLSKTTLYWTSTWDANAIFSDSSFTNPGTDFSLLSSSPAIDVGLDLGSPYNNAISPGSAWPSAVTSADQDTEGSGWDLGAYAFIPSSAKAITAFNFNGLSPAVTGTIDEGNHTIALTVPYGTNVTSLIPTVTITGTSVVPNSEVTQNFTNPVTYTVTAADASTQEYIVTVTIAANSEPFAAPDNDEENYDDLDIFKVKYSIIDDNQIKITFKTNNYSKGTVRFGIDRNLKQKKKESKNKKKHTIRLKNLISETKYYFRVSAKDRHDQSEQTKIYTVILPKIATYTPITTKFTSKPQVTVPISINQSQNTQSPISQNSNQNQTNENYDRNNAISNSNSIPILQSQPQKSNFVWWKPWTWF